MAGMQWSESTTDILPASQNDQEQPMSPLTGGPQYGMSSNGDMSQYGMHGLPYMPGPQNGHSSSVDSTFGGYQSMGGTENFPLLPPYEPASAQQPMSVDEMHQRFGRWARPSDCKLIFTCITHARNTQHFTSRPEGKQDRKQQLDSTRQPHSYDVPRPSKCLHPTSAERTARASCSLSSSTHSDPLLQI